MPDLLSFASLCIFKFPFLRAKSLSCNSHTAKALAREWSKGQDSRYQNLRGYRVWLSLPRSSSQVVFSVDTCRKTKETYDLAAKFELASLRMNKQQSRKGEWFGFSSEPLLRKCFAMLTHIQGSTNSVFSKPCLCLSDTRHFRHFRRFRGSEERSPWFHWVNASSSFSFFFYVFSKTAPFWLFGRKTRFTKP